MPPNVRCAYDMLFTVVFVSFACAVSIFTQLVTTFFVGNLDCLMLVCLCTCMHAYVCILEWRGYGTGVGLGREPE